MDWLLKFVWVFLLGVFVSPDAKCQGIITTIAGDGYTRYTGDGSPATDFSLGGPAGICMDRIGNLFIANLYTSRISKLTNATLKTIVDTSGTSGYSGDGGLADTATIASPIGVCTDTAGNIYFTDVYFDVVREVNVEGFISTVCGSGSAGSDGDGGPATLAQMQTPHGSCIDKFGNLYIADFGNNKVRVMNLVTGIINTFAGTGVNSYSGDNGPASAAGLSNPSSVCTDASGNVYIAEHGNHRIRMVNATTGIISTFAGNGVQDYTGDGGLAVDAALNQPNCVFIDSRGIMYISDFGNNVIRAVTPQGLIYTIAGSGGYGNTGDGGPAIDATFDGPTAVYVNNAGYIYIADGNNSEIREVTPITFPVAGVKQVNQASSFNIYPDPAVGGKFTVNLFAQQASMVIMVTNAIGDCVYNSPVNGSQVQIDLSGNAQGLYLVQVTSPDGIFTRKVVLE